MKLKYSILWFDDDVDQIESHDFDVLAETIHSWGFDFDGPAIVNTPSEFMEKTPFLDFDLIVVDYNLGDDETHGDDFIKSLRDQNVYTDVVFYTGGSTASLWDGVRDKKLEGVFLSNVAGIIPKVIRVAKQSVKKIVDLENMRGIVMAQVGDLDQDLKQLLSVGFLQLEPLKQNQIFKKFIKDGNRRGKNLSEEFEEFAKDPTIERMLDLCDSSFPIWSLSRSMCNRHPSLEEFNISDYENEILKPRNALAHGVPNTAEDGIQTFVHREYKFQYTDKTAEKIRHDLKKYKGVFRNIYDKLQ